MQHLQQTFIKAAVVRRRFYGCYISKQFTITHSCSFKLCKTCVTQLSGLQSRDQSCLRPLKSVRKFHGTILTPTVTTCMLMRQFSRNATAMSVCVPWNFSRHVAETARYVPWIFTEHNGQVICVPWKFSRNVSATTTCVAWIFTERNT